MNNSQDSINKIKAYANNFNQSIINNDVLPFVINGTKIPFNQIVTTLMTDMSWLFYTVRFFNEPISSWDTSNVTNMNFMFYGASHFSENISGWIVTNVNPKPPSGFSTNSGLTNPLLLPPAFR